jgi:plastocyanin
MIASLQRQFVVASVAAALLGCVGGAGAQQQVAATGPAQISIDNFNFSPSTLTIAAGTKVTWVNNDEEPHTVVNVDQPTRVFRSGGLDSGDTYSFVFDKPGTYDYICSIHPHMSGKIVVK